MTEQEADNFLKQMLPRYERVTRIASSLIENILRQEGIEFLNVAGRTKTHTSALEKFRRKSYENIGLEMTDLSGIRIITYLDSQVTQISNVISKAFSIDDKNSLDRSQILGDDRVSYRSVHFVCSLGAPRQRIIEYRDLCDIPFEIQIRTVLQHAWAELTHDRSYKFGGVLPSHLQRKLNLYAGMLEVVDDAFDEIARSVDEYAEKLRKDNLNELRNETINSISLIEFIKKFSQRHKVEIENLGANENVIIERLTNFGIKNIGELEDLITDECATAIKANNLHNPASAMIGFILVYSDPERFHSSNVGNLPGAIRAKSLEVLKEKFGDDRIDRLVKDYGLKIFGIE